MVRVQKKEIKMKYDNTLKTVNVVHGVDPSLTLPPAPGGPGVNAELIIIWWQLCLERTDVFAVVSSNFQYQYLIKGYC